MCVGQDSGCVGSKWRLDSMRGQSKMWQSKMWQNVVWAGAREVRYNRVAMWRRRCEAKIGVAHTKCVAVCGREVNVADKPCVAVCR